MQTKIISSIFFIFFTIATFAQQHRLEKIWETDSIVAIPESVLYSPSDNLLYISLIDGSPWEADGEGGVATLKSDGTDYKADWITGLNAPKGMGIFDGKLYVADLADVVVINIEKGEIENKIHVAGAEGLNDITIDNGIIYVSDSRKGQVWKIEGTTPALLLDNAKGINGLKFLGDDLYLGLGKSFKKMDKNKTQKNIAEVTEGIDGIEPTGTGDFILTSWVGLIYYVHADGKVEQLLDSREKMNSADLGFNQEQQILYVPTFNSKKIVAYSLK